MQVPAGSPATKQAIDFVNRGKDREITTPFDIKSDVCRTCGACMYICPACELRCQGPDASGDVCGGCANVLPVCLEDLHIINPTREDIRKVAEAACAEEETIHATWFPVFPEMVEDAIWTSDAMGKEYKKIQLA